MRVILIAATQLLNHIPGYIPHDPELGVSDSDELAEEAGRLCYESWSRPNPATATNDTYLDHIQDVGHVSILEHGSASFYIDGVSRTFTHELIRHRHLSPSEVSQRYVDVSQYQLVVPPLLRESWGEEMHTLSNTEKMYYDQTMKNHEDIPRKEARQAARAFLPAGLETKILITGNHRAWRDVLPKRFAPGADAEFQLVAKEVLRQLKGVAPNSYQDIEVP